MAWDDIHYFLGLARTGTLSATAREFNVEHTTVARRVTQLETDLGVRLFNRWARGWTLTPEGEDLLPKAEAVEQEVLSLKIAAAGADQIRGKVRVTAPPLFLSHLIIPGLRAFRQNWPNIFLDLVAETRVADIGRGEADIAVRIGRPEEPSLVVRLVGYIRYGLFGLPEICEKFERDGIFIGFNAGMSEFPQKTWLDGQVADENVPIRSNDMMSLVQAARCGLGIAHLPRYLAEEHPELVEVKFESEPLVRPIYLTMHQDIRRSQRVRLVADHLMDTLKPVFAT